MSIDVLTTVYIGNALGVALLLVLYFSNRSRMSDDTDVRYVLKLLFFAFFACIVDPLVYTVDGRPGFVNTLIIYLGNSWLYLVNMLTGMYWVRFLIAHLGLKITKTRKIMHRCLFIFGCVCLVLNLFIPLVFSVSDNVYQREFLYPIYVLIAAFYMVDSLVVYYENKRSGGVLTFFSVYVFLVPVVIGVVVQSLFYGISVIWASVAIAIAGLMTALKNEVIFTDPLTGLYNRFYLEQLQKKMVKKNVFITGVMADLNGFKLINDRYGHASGDEALIIAANLFKQAVGQYDTVTRYAGDEFLILLNSVDEDQVQNLIGQIRETFEGYNAKKEKPYTLSVALGYSTLDLKHQSINEFMNKIDMKMYENKLEYYKGADHDRRNR